MSLRRGAAISTALALSACGQSVRHAPAGAASTATSDPRGRDGQLLVLDEFGRPFANLPVLVDAALTATGDDGFAALPDVGSSYDVSLLDDHHAHVFQGLRSRAPVIQLASMGPAGGTLSETTLQLQKPPDLGDDTLIRFMAGIGKAAEATPLLTYSTNDSDVELQVVWPEMERPTLSVEAFLVQVDPLTEEPLAYPGYAAEDWPAVSPSVTWTPPFDSPPFEALPVHVDLTLPDGASVRYYDAFASDGSGRRGSLGYALGNPDADASTGASADMLVPDVPDTTYAVLAHTTTDDGGFVAQGPDGVHAGDSVSLVALAPPAELAPPSGALIDTATDFAWAPVEGAVHYLFIFAPDASSVFDVTVATMASHTRLPDLSALGVPFPLAPSIRWIANAVTGVGSLDAYAAGAPSRGYGYSGYRDAAFAP